MYKYVSTYTATSDYNEAETDDARKEIFDAVRWELQRMEDLNRAYRDVLRHEMR